MTITTRKGAKSDKESLWKLHVASMRGYIEQVWGWDDAIQQEFFDNGFHPEDIHIIQVEGQDVGMYELTDREDDFFLTLIEILPEFQNRGISSEIIRKMIDEIRPTGKPFRLQVLKINPAQALYARLGFSISGETETHYQMGLPNNRM